MILLLLLSLCATECRIVEKCDTVIHWERWPINGGDSVSFDGGKYAGYGYIYYDYRCHPETTLVDSGVPSSPQWVYQKYGRSKLPAQALDSADLADIREMPKKLRALSQEIRALRRQMDFRTCLDTLVIKRQYYWRTLHDSMIVSDTLPHISVKDSCECVNGGGK